MSTLAFSFTANDTSVNCVGHRFVLPSPPHTHNFAASLFVQWIIHSYVHVKEEAEEFIRVQNSRKKKEKVLYGAISSRMCLTRTTELDPSCFISFPQWWNFMLENASWIPGWMTTISVTKERSNRFWMVFFLDPYFCISLNSSCWTE